MKKTIVSLTAIVFTVALVGCVSAEPLPTNQPPTTLVWSPSPTTNVVSYQPFYLTNSASDSDLKLQSVNWTPLPQVAGTNCSIAGLPPALLTVTAIDSSGQVSPFATPVSNVLPTPDGVPVLTVK